MVNDSMKTIAWAADNFTCSMYAFSIAIPLTKGIAIEKAYKNINMKCIQEH